MGRGRARTNAESFEKTPETKIKIRIPPRVHLHLPQVQVSASKAFFCYILECSDGTYYTGWTTDPQRRLRQHNAGRGAKYTRSRRPVRLVYVEEQPDRSSAMRREFQIKQMSREAKEKLIRSK